ncbi:putative hydrolase, partial [Globisporangium splendens]
MSCCPVTALPEVLGTAAAFGKLRKFNNTSLFTAVPPTGATKIAILGFPNVCGTDSGRTKADAVALSLLGYAVAVVDLTDGNYLTPETLPEIDGIDFLQSEFNVESIASYGYCWGSYVGARQSALPNPIIKGNVSFHPSWRVENMINGEGAAEKLTERITVPQLLLAAGDDPAFVRENGSVIKILSEKSETSAHSKMIDSPDMNHGWVNRGDVEKPEVKTRVATARHHAIEFFKTVAPQ